MTLVDTHCHLGGEAYAADRGAVLERAWAAGVGHVVVIGESPEAAPGALALAAGDARLSATAGLHPHEASRWTAGMGEWLAAALRDPRVVAVGETGLDYHYDHSPRPAQREAFEAQLELARAAGKPAVIHAREADDDVLAVLRNHPRTVAVLHSFSSGAALLVGALALGHYVSFSGMVTFRSWQADDLVRAVPADRLLVETDGPYLAPVPLRGRRNEPAFVRHVAERVAAVRDEPVEELVAATGANARRLFGPRVAGATE